METSKTKKTSSLFALAIAATSLLAWVTPSDYYQSLVENDLIRSIKEKLSAYNTHLPEERLYLQMDKPMYEPGDDIWVSAYVRDGISLKASKNSDIIHFELINPKGTVEKKISVIAKNGKAAGDFSLDKEALGGLYKIRAYTNWMKNESGAGGEENVFEKEIQVQDVVLPALKMKLDFERKAFGAGDEVIAKLELNTNENKPLADHKIKFIASLNGSKIIDKGDVTDENGIQYIKFQLPAELKSNDGLLNIMIDYNGSTESISRSIPIVLNKIKLTLFPEGGDMIQGLDNTVAFNALNEFGKPADIEGVVLTEKGSRVASFSSFHQGMGAFKINPQPNEKYHVKITKPEGIQETFLLPESLERGYNMSVDNSKEGEVSVNINSTEKEALAVVAQVRGKVYYSTLIDAKPGTTKFVFPTSDFPTGVAQITLFDSEGIARAERLAFVNKNRQLNISVETEKEKYLPREKVKMTLNVKDERGMPIPANLSMAVVNDQFLSFADDKSGNILSQLLLQQDVTGKIEEPAFYFNSKEAKADKALDYLLMTSGWRRFSWEKVMEEELPQIMYPAQKAIVSGYIYDAYTGKAIEDVTIKTNNGKEYKADADGKFSLRYLDLSSPQNLNCLAKGYYAQTQTVYDYNQNMVFYLYKEMPQQIGWRHSKAGAGRAAVHPNDIPASMAREEMAMEMAPQLDAVMSQNNLKKMAKGPGNDKQKFNEQEKAEPKKAEGKEIAKKEEQLKDRDDAKVAVAGKIEDRRFRNLADDESDLGSGEQLPQNIYYRARQFYAPKYNKEENVENRTDFRNTIYWNPNVEIGYSGKKTIEFYASDDITSFRTTVEGIGNNGLVGRTEKNFFSQLPFAMTTKIPVEVATEDYVSIPLTLKNNTDGPLGGLITITAPDGLKEIAKLNPVQTIMPGAAKTIYLDYKVLDKIGYGEFTIGFKACGLGDAFTQKIKIAPKGFPVQTSFAGQETEKEYEFEIKKLVNGSLKASFSAYPNVVSDLMKGVEGILQEPYGCFEQTSSSNYPNIMVLSYHKNMEVKNPELEKNSPQLLDAG